MSAQSLFSKKNIESQKLDTRQGIMEELNLPPEVISFVRKNSRNLQICLIIFVILVFSWIFYDYYSERQENKSASLELAHLDYEEGAFDAAVAKYEEIAAKLPSDSSLVPLVRINLAQSYEEAGQHDQAIIQYNLLKNITGFKEDAYMALGRIYRAKEDFPQARKEYNELLNTMGDDIDPQLRSKVQALLNSLDV
jgi:predicted negative regulator of RcsB-dependent stress response